MNIKLAAAMLATLAALASGEAIAQQYPTRAIRFLVGSPPGSGNDLVSRLLGQKLSERFGQAFMLEVFAGFVVMLGTAGGIFLFPAALSLSVNVVLIGFELLVASLQAYVFAILTCIYLHDAVHLH